MKLALVILWLAVTGQAGDNATPLVASESAQRLHQRFGELYFADLVVRGAVLNVEMKSVRADEYDTEWSGRGGHFSVARVTFSVAEVLKGYFDRSEIECYINTSQSTLAWRYSAGDEMILCLLYRPELYGGSYVVWSGGSRFIREGEAWRQLGAWGGLSTLGELQAVLAPTQLEAVAASSGIVAVGKVTGVRQNEISSPDEAGTKRSSRVWQVDLETETVLQGRMNVGPQTFEVFYAGSYWPVWAHAGPEKIMQETRYCVFLNESEGKLYATWGVNALYRLTNDNRLMHNDLPLPVTPKDVAAFARQYTYS